MHCVEKLLNKLQKKNKIFQECFFKHNFDPCDKHFFLIMRIVCAENC